MAAEEKPGDLRELAVLFLKLGTVAFGGPAAHVAMMREEVVARRRWMSDEEFLDLFGATNLIPGPNSTELAIHLGRTRAGWRGLAVAGVCFILPAALIVLAFAALYARYGTTPAVENLLYGITPVVIAVVAVALWNLLRTAVKGPLTAAVGAAVLPLYLLGVPEIPLLAAGAVIVLVARSFRPGGGLFSFLPLGLLVQVPGVGLPSIGLPGIGQLFFSFLKIGAVLFGSGYVLLAFLRSEFVASGLLTEQQLIDAVAVGQVTPGPVFTTATFVGYLLGGVPGAAVATVGIFLPAFVFVAITGPLIPRLRSSPVAARILDGVNVASLALMTGVTWQLGRAAIVGPVTAGISVLALLLLLRTRVNPAWLVLGGGVAGLLYRTLFS